MKKIVTLALMVSMPIMFTACTSSSGASIENKSPSFQNGAKAGCATANGEYTKNHEAFNSDMEYQNGWFHGRQKCNSTNTGK